METCTYEAVARIVELEARKHFIQENCSGNFDFIDFVWLYSIELGQWGVLIMGILAVLVPLLFLQIGVVADRYLAFGMNKLAHRLRLSPVLGAMTVVSFANGAPDIISSLANSDRAEGASLSVATLLGAFIFSSTLVVANVIFRAPEPIKMARPHLLREFFFYFSALATICLLGIYGKMSPFFVAAFLGLYVLYVLVTLRMDAAVPTAFPEDKPAGKAPVALSPEDPNEDPEFVTWQKKDEEVTDQRHSRLNGSPKLPFSDALVVEVLDWEDGALSSLLTAPLKFLCLFFVPHWGNPLLGTPFRVFVYQGSVIFITLSYITGFSHPPPLMLLLSGSLGAVLFLVEMSGRLRSPLVYCRILGVVLVSIGLIKIFAGLIIDAITFLAFYFNVDHVILSAVFLSCGNTLGDFFANGALSAHGETLMAGLASFSGQTFNCLLGLAVALLQLLRKGETDFDIFGLRRESSNSFLVFLLLFAVGSLGMHLAYNWASEFTWRPKFGWVLGGSYLVFLGASVAFGALSSNKT